MNPDQIAAISEIKDILVNYDLGELIDLERNERGFVNTSYAIETIKQGKSQKYFLRAQYSRPSDETLKCNQDYTDNYSSYSESLKLSDFFI
jgi:hypothetical protein